MTSGMLLRRRTALHPALAGAPAGPWLDSWAKRQKLTIDHTKIDTDLTWFPLPIRLGAFSVDVFATLGAARKKIAVTKDDATTQLYVEIETWQNGSLYAVLWVSKSDWTISSTTDTDIYLYWDPGQADNTTYVGDVGGRTEVWDSNFAVVHHLAGLNDSTDNNLDGTLTDSPSQISGILGGGAYDFDGSNDLFVIPDSTVYNQPRNELTIEGWAREDAYTQFRGFWGKKPWGATTGFHLYKDAASGATGTVQAAIYQSGGSFNNAILTSAPKNWLGTDNDGLFHYVAQDQRPVGNGEGRLYIDGVLEATDTFASGQTNINNGSAVTLGGFVGSNYNNCAVDEFRISLAQRPAAYHKANYEGGQDNLNTFSPPEVYPG
jgi:hypothetical protein